MSFADTNAPSSLVQLKAAITAQLVSEMVSGRIAGVAMVGSTWLDDVAIWPYVSVFAKGRTERVEAVRRRRSTCDFIIGVAYKSLISIEDAYTNVYNLMADGQGNGLEAILSDGNYFSWNGLCGYSQIMETQYYDNVGDNKTAAMTSFIAYAAMRYQTIQILNWGLVS
jgi:hypothetical protein